MTVRRLVIAKVLPATQPVPYAPWAIRREDLTLEQVQRAAAFSEMAAALRGEDVRPEIRDFLARTRREIL